MSWDHLGHNRQSCLHANSAIGTVVCVHFQVAAMQAGNVYRPTEDTAGQHRQLLTALANTVLQHAKHAMQAASTTGECYDVMHHVSSCAALGCTGWSKLRAFCVL